MRQNLLPVLLLVGGVLAVVAYAYLWIFASDERPIQFAIACLVAVLGWRELTATDELYERD